MEQVTAFGYGNTELRVAYQELNSFAGETERMRQIRYWTS